MKPYLILDIETGPLPESHQRQIIPSEWPLGNLKDPEKIKLATVEKEKEWFESATLDAKRCEVLAIGLRDSMGWEAHIHGATEKERLQSLLQTVGLIEAEHTVGHNLLGFDIPMLVRRMWANGIKPPSKWLDCRPWKADWAFDTALAWSCGNSKDYVKLDHLAFHLGVGRKNGDGAMFWKTYQEDQKKALAYLSNDLQLTEKCYLRMI